MAQPSEILSRFLAQTHTLPNICRDFPEWHLGRQKYLFWAINANFDQVQVQCLAAQQHLAMLLLANYRRQPHITLSLCGFPCAHPTRQDDFGEKDLLRQVAALTQTNFQAFEIELGGLASFSSAPFFHVAETLNTIGPLRNCLQHAATNNHTDDYTPHITVGLYADAWPSQTVHRRLQSFQPSSRPRYVIDRIELMSYVAAEIGGPLTTLAEYSFANKNFNWLTSSPFQHSSNDS